MVDDAIVYSSASSAGPACHALRLNDDGTNCKQPCSSSTIELLRRHVEVARYEPGSTVHLDVQARLLEDLLVPVRHALTIPEVDGDNQQASFDDSFQPCRAESARRSCRRDVMVPSWGHAKVDVSACCNANSSRVFATAELNSWCPLQVPLTAPGTKLETAEVLLTDMVLLNDQRRSLDRLIILLEVHHS